MAAAAVLAAVSHLASTSVFDLLAWTALSWLVIRALAPDADRDGGRETHRGGARWLLVGVCAGVSLEIKTPPVFLLFALLVGVVVAGPRQALASRWLFFPYQVVLISPVPIPVWIAGLVRLARDPGLAAWRCFAVAYPVLVVVFVAVGASRTTCAACIRRCSPPEPSRLWRGCVAESPGPRACDSVSPSPCRRRCRAC